MKKLKIIFGIGVLAIAGYFTIAADHIDAPAVAGGNSDITDFYAFQGENTDNIAFATNVRGLISPGSPSQNASFDENVMIEINIDTNSDNIEDMVIQAVPQDGQMFIYGPYMPESTGLDSRINMDAGVTVFDITPYTESAITVTNPTNGVMAFAGLRDDPFFMDFAQYGEIIAGNETSFNDPGTDTFAGTNVMSIVVEVPKALIGGTGTINTWVETKRKQ